jgi:hypothetical protein
VLGGRVRPSLSPYPCCAELRAKHVANLRASLRDPSLPRAVRLLAFRKIVCLHLTELMHQQGLANVHGLVR